MTVKDYIAVGCIAVSLLVCSFIMGRVTAPAPPVEPLSRDTVVITRTDTITREKPVYYAKRATDTLRLVVRDTVRQRDTLWLAVEREQRAYRDTSYEAWVSGVQPSLDSIRVFAPVRCVTVTERVPVKVRSRWGLGVTAGYGATYSDKGGLALAPYFGAGVTYSILSW